VYLGSRLLASIESGTTTTWYHVDVLGSVRAITSSAGATLTRHDYAPFGESNSSLTGDPRRFLGQELDEETALEHFGARQYRNVWGRFAATDPIFSAGARTNPQLWNRYGYGLNGPLRYSDSSGLEPEDSDDKSGTGAQVDDVYFVSYQDAITAFFAGQQQLMSWASLNLPWQGAGGDQGQTQTQPQNPVPSPNGPSVGQAALDCVTQHYFGITVATATTLWSLPTSKSAAGVGSGLLGSSDKMSLFRGMTFQTVGKGPTGVTWKPIVRRLRTTNLFGQIGRVLPGVSQAMWAWDIASVSYCTYTATRGR
jgi:RHS repeat-associated protein